MQQEPSLPSLGVFNHFTSSVWHKAWSGAKNPLDSRFCRIVLVRDAAAVWMNGKSSSRYLLLYICSIWRLASSSRSSTFFWSPDDIWLWHCAHTTDQLQCDVVSLVHIGVHGQLHPRRCRHDTLKGNRRVKHKDFEPKDAGGDIEKLVGDAFA